MINGKTLIEMGYAPAKWFAEVINTANEQGLNEYEIRLLTNSLIPPDPIALLEDPIIYSEFLEPEGEDEIANLNIVRDVMNDLMRTPTVIGGAIMPDVCPVGGRGQIPVGAVVITHNAVHPAMHSADVCCSVMTTNLGKVDPKEVLDIAFETTQFGAGGRKEHGGWEELFYDNKPLVDDILSNYYTKDYVVKAAKHLGTQGDGNHFLFVGISENTGDTHLVTHHGSRGFGASVYMKGMRTAEMFRRRISPETLPVNAWIPMDEYEGEVYWEALQIVRKWTKFNHEVIHDRIANKLKVQYLDRFWNEHNFVFRDGDMYYHAKGSTPMSDKFVPDNQTGLRLIPLNMSEPILIAKQKVGMLFAPHGAGRNFSRTEHKRRNERLTKEQQFVKETEGLDVRFFSGNIDISELPSAYKNAESVIKDIEKFGIADIVDKILPYGSIMAGEFEKKW